MRDTLLRTALWQVHQRLCAYCGELVTFAELQADHIIPVTLKTEKAECERVLTGLGLPLTVDLDAAWNRLPSHGRCNRRKSDDLLKESNLRYFLELAAKAEPKIIQETIRLQEQARSDRVKAALAIAVAAGEVSVGEIVQTAVTAGSGPQLIARAQGRTSSSKLIQAVADGAAISTLLAQPILPRPHGLEVLTMSRDDNRTTVRSCADWAARSKAGYHPTTNYDKKEEAFFKKAYAIMRALELAAPSATSFLQMIRFNTESAAFLRASFLPYLSPNDEVMVKDWIARGVSLLELSRTDGVVLETTDSGILIRWKGMSAYLREILRADLDGDGVEDMLYSYYYRVDQGTFAGFSVGVLTRRSSVAMLEPVVIADLHP